MNLASSCNTKVLKVVRIADWWRLLPNSERKAKVSGGHKTIVSEIIPAQLVGVL